MSAFFSFIRETFEAVFRNIGRFFVTIFADPWINTGSDFSEYGLIFSTYRVGFGVGGWILYVIFIVLLFRLSRFNGLLHLLCRPQGHRL